MRRIENRLTIGRQKLLGQVCRLGAKLGDLSMRNPPFSSANRCHLVPNATSCSKYDTKTFPLYCHTHQLRTIGCNGLKLVRTNRKMAIPSNICMLCKCLQHPAQRCNQPTTNCWLVCKNAEEEIVVKAGNNSFELF